MWHIILTRVEKGDVIPDNKGPKVASQLSLAATTKSSVQTRALCTVGWGYRIYQLHLCIGVRPLHNECPGYDTKNLWGIFHYHHSQFHSGPEW